MHHKYLWPLIMGSILVNLWWGWQVLAGPPDAPDGPETTLSYTLEDLYQRLNTGTAGTPSTFTEPSVAPGTTTMHTLNEIMVKAPAPDNTSGASPMHILAGKTFWGLTTGQWGVQTGTMPNNGAVTLVPTTTNRSIAAGYHNGAGYVEGDADLTADNIRQGTALFGVVGTLAGGDTDHAGVPKTGQTLCYSVNGIVMACAGTGQDGELQKGVAWPSPRFTDTGNGTATDNLTGLIWLKNANCAGTARNWTNALNDVAQLNISGTMNGNNCADTSNGGGHQTDWRLPNVRELQSLIDYGQVNPALPSGHPFTGVELSNYWSSSTYVLGPNAAWIVILTEGIVSGSGKTSNNYVWPVRGGQ